jgi:hypothetical protein
MEHGLSHDVPANNSGDGALAMTEDQLEDPAMTSTKTTTGNNDRPKNETIAQTGDGIPDDAGDPIAVSDAEVERVRKKLVGGDAHAKLMKDVQQDIDLPQKGSA